MTANVYLQENIKNSFFNFKRQKGVSCRDVVENICNDLEKYNNMAHIAPESQKTKMSFNCEAEDFVKLQAFWKKLKNNKSFGDFISHLILNYMYAHKDDDVISPDEKGKSVSVYLTAKEWAEIKEKKGNKKTAEYIKEVLFNA